MGDDVTLPNIYRVRVRIMFDSQLVSEVFLTRKPEILNDVG